MRRVVAVVGPGDAPPEVLAAAHEVGRLAAAAGFVVATGGLGGVMAAACAGAHEAGGTTLGVLPGHGGANADVDIAIGTGMGQGRNAVLVGAADAVVAVGCSWGTLSEIALAMRAGKPVVTLLGWTVTDAAGAVVPVPVAADAEAAMEFLSRAVPA
jgi:uncharacterized protein (TIGR00725 family)